VTRDKTAGFTVEPEILVKKRFCSSEVGAGVLVVRIAWFDLVAIGVGFLLEAGSWNSVMII